MPPAATASVSEASSRMTNANGHHALACSRPLAKGRDRVRAMYRSTSRS
jgi:hypothetical protein